MAKFVTIGYGDQAGYEKTPADVLKAAHAHDEDLARRGALIGIAGAPVQVRNHGGKKVETRSGAVLTSPLPIAGFAVIEARDLDEAIALVSRSPCAVAEGVVEIWPLQEP